jgi:hypothetical protein
MTHLTFEEKYKRWHTYCSYAKSVVRIAACVMVLSLFPWLSGAGILAMGFFLAELIGIAEEWV